MPPPHRRFFHPSTPATSLKFLAPSRPRLLSPQYQPKGRSPRSPTPTVGRGARGSEQSGHGSRCARPRVPGSAHAPSRPSGGARAGSAAGRSSPPVVRGVQAPSCPGWAGGSCRFGDMVQVTPPWRIPERLTRRFQLHPPSNRTGHQPRLAWTDVCTETLHAFPVFILRHTHQRMIRRQSGKRREVSIST